MSIRMPRIAAKQVSDIVSKSTILAVANDCDKMSCVFSCALGATTCAGINRAYDVNGDLMVNDGNRRTTDVICRSCWRGWEVSQYGDEILSVVEIKEEY
jgi:hypothetical protein